MPRRHLRYRVVPYLAALLCLLSACGRIPTPPPSSEGPAEPTTQGQDNSSQTAEPYLFNRVVALCIGIENYRFVAEAPFAEADAKAVGELLQSRFGFSSDIS